MKPEIQYFIVTDPEGAITGDQFVPITHRAGFDRTGVFYGYHSLPKLFSVDESFHKFCQRVMSESSGTSGRLEWRYD